MTDDKNAALIARLRGPLFSDADMAMLTAEAADALEAAVQSPAVDREKVRALLDAHFSSSGRDAMTDAIMGVLQDAREVEARGLEKAAGEVRGVAGLGTATSGHTRTYSVRQWLIAYARQVREGTK